MLDISDSPTWTHLLRPSKGWCLFSRESKESTTLPKALKKFLVMKWIFSFAPWSFNNPLRPYFVQGGVGTLKFRCFLQLCRPRSWSKVQNSSGHDAWTLKPWRLTGRCKQLECVKNKKAQQIEVLDWPRFMYTIYTHIQFYLNNLNIYFYF